MHSALPPSHYAPRGAKFDAGRYVARHAALPASIEDAEVVGRARLASVGGLLPPAVRLDEIVLRFSQALIGSASIPLRGLARISNHSPPFLVGQAEIKLRLRLTLAGQRLELTERPAIVTGAKGGQAGREIGSRDIARKHPQKGGEHSASCTSVPPSR